MALIIPPWCRGNLVSVIFMIHMMPARSAHPMSRYSMTQLGTVVNLRGGGRGGVLQMILRGGNIGGERERQHVLDAGIQAGRRQEESKEEGTEGHNDDCASSSVEVIEVSEVGEDSGDKGLVERRENVLGVERQAGVVHIGNRLRGREKQGDRITGCDRIPSQKDSSGDDSDDVVGGLRWGVVNQPASGFSDSDDCRNQLRNILSRPTVAEYVSSRKCEASGAAQDSQQESDEMTDAAPLCGAQVDPQDADAAGPERDAGGGAVDRFHGEGVQEQQLQQPLDAADGVRMLFEACDEGDVHKARMLLARGVSVQAQDAKRAGATALHVASELGDLPMVKALLKAGADPNACNVCGSRPLHLAASKGKTEIAQELLLRGASLLAPDDFGSNAADEAEKGKHATCLKMLEEHIQVLMTRRRYMKDSDSSPTRFKFEAKDVNAVLRRLETEEAASEARGGALKRSRRAHHEGTKRPLAPDSEEEDPPWFRD